MKVGEIWKYNPRKYISVENQYGYNNRVRISKLYFDRIAGECVSVILEDGTSPRAVDSMSDYTVEHFLSVYTKVYNESR